MDNKPKQDHHLVPVVTVILAIAAFIAMYAYAIWPSDSEMSISPVLVRHKKTNTNVIMTNTSVKNTNTVTR